MTTACFWMVLIGLAVEGFCSELTGLTGVVLCILLLEERSPVL